jgi:nanoRNase/pAp phosphatase (c-di-AMP/oligoRNAs hydrolase)
VVILTERPELFTGVTVSDETAYAKSVSQACRIAADFDGDVVVVIDIGDDAAAQDALDRVNAARPDAGIIVLYETGCPTLPEDAAVSAVRWSELMRLDLRDEIERVRTRELLRQLREFADGDDLLPILMHPDPDPDALASAYALRVLLRRRPDTCPIVTPALMTRPENKRMAELLNMRVTEVSREEMQRFQRVICVDSQPKSLGLAEVPRLAVIDHHPAETGYNAEFSDIRPQYGACSTILTQYLRSDVDRRIAEPLATALLHAIKTDTAALTRGITPDDVAAYAYLQRLADMELLHRIEQPSNPQVLVRTFGRALHELAVDDGVSAAYLGPLDPDHAHILADVADFALSIDEVVWAAVAAEIGNELVVSLRHTNTEPGAGSLARQLAGKDGNGGGHATMARVAIPLSRALPKLAQWQGTSAERLLEWIRQEIQGLRCSDTTRPM